MSSASVFDFDGARGLPEIATACMGEFVAAVTSTPAA